MRKRSSFGVWPRKRFTSIGSNVSVSTSSSIADMREALCAGRAPAYDLRPFGTSRRRDKAPDRGCARSQALSRSDHMTWLRDNGLTLTLLGLFAVSIAGQA